MFQEGYGYPKTSQTFSITGTSAATTNAVGAHIHCVRVSCDTDAWITIAKAPTATAADVFMPANHVDYFVIHPGEKVAAIGTAGECYVTEMTR